MLWLEYNEENIDTTLLEKLVWANLQSGLQCPNPARAAQLGVVWLLKFGQIPNGRH